MTDEFRLICNAFDETLKLQQLSKYSNKYNKVLTYFCDILIKRLEEDDGVFEKILTFNCFALKAAIEFSSNPNSTLFNIPQIYGTTESMQIFLNVINEHLTQIFHVDVESLDEYSAIRLKEIIHLNCKIFIELFNCILIRTDIELFNHLIKNLCLVLYEIITPRLKTNQIFHDVLQQYNSNTLKLVLELKIEALQKFTDDKNEPQIIQKMIEIHDNLLSEITNYIDATITDISESE